MHHALANDHHGFQLLRSISADRETSGGTARTSIRSGSSFGAGTPNLTAASPAEPAATTTAMRGPSDLVFLLTWS